MQLLFCMDVTLPSHNKPRLFSLMQNLVVEMSLQQEATSGRIFLRIRFQWFKTYPGSV